MREYEIPPSASLYFPETLSRGNCSLSWNLRRANRLCSSAFVTQTPREVKSVECLCLKGLDLNYRSTSTADGFFAGKCGNAAGNMSRWTFPSQSSCYSQNGTNQKLRNCAADGAVDSIFPSFPEEILCFSWQNVRTFRNRCSKTTTICRVQEVAHQDI